MRARPSYGVLDRAVQEQGGAKTSVEGVLNHVVQE